MWKLLYRSGSIIIFVVLTSLAVTRIVHVSDCITHKNVDPKSDAHIVTSSLKDIEPLEV